MLGPFSPNQSPHFKAAAAVYTTLWFCESSDPPFGLARLEHRYTHRYARHDLLADGYVRVSRLKWNIIANFVGNGWAALMAIALVPLYIQFMGIEAYGLVGVFVTLQALLGLADMGLSATLNREMARLSLGKDQGQTMRNLLRTLEMVFWPLGLVLGLGVIVLAPFIAQQWLGTSGFSISTTQRAVMLMGSAVALQWPFGYYSGALLGLQRQVLLNAILIVTATVRGVGAVLILWLVSPTVIAFFVWQMVASLLQTGLVAGFTWRSLPRIRAQPRFEPHLLQRIWRFAAGVSGITLMGVILTQLDKLVLSRLLSLEMFGYYTLAGVVATSLHRFVSPIFSALYPRLTELVAGGEEWAVQRLYHRSSQLTAVVILPVAIIMAFFSPEILLLWTRDPNVVQQTSLVLSLLVVGTALNGLMNVPYALQLAYGWTRLAFYTNLAAVLLFAPTVVLATSRYGATGAAAVWILVNIGFLLFFVTHMHRRLLQGEKWKWYFEDMGLPMMAALTTAGLGRWIMPEGVGSATTLVWLGCIALGTLLSAVLAASQVRPLVLNRLRTAIPAPA